MRLDTYMALYLHNRTAIQAQAYSTTPMWLCWVPYAPIQKTVFKPHPPYIVLLNQSCNVLCRYKPTTIGTFTVDHTTHTTLEKGLVWKDWTDEINCIAPQPTHVV
jgi:hypothetical protein